MPGIPLCSSSEPRKPLHTLLRRHVGQNGEAMMKNTLPDPLDELEVVQASTEPSGPQDGRLVLQVLPNERLLLKFVLAFRLQGLLQRFFSEMV